MKSLVAAKILADENISPRVVSFLRQKNIDVIDTKEQNWHGKSDEFLLQKAFDDCRFILTHDADFGTLAIKCDKPCFGILYLRLKSPCASNVIKTLEKLFEVPVDIKPGSLVVIDESRIRIRLPSRPVLKRVSEPAAEYEPGNKSDTVNKNKARARR